VTGGLVDRQTKVIDELENWSIGELSINLISKIIKEEGANI